MEDKKILICACNSLEHQVMFWYWPEYKMLYAEFHLQSYDNFFKRLWYGLKFAFGYKSRFGAWDEFMFDQENLEKLNEFLSEQQNEILKSQREKSLEIAVQFINETPKEEIDALITKAINKQ